MKPLYENAPENGPKTPIEDAMYPMYTHCVFNLNPRACSIDTPLHTLVPFKHVDHLHPNAVIAIAASVNQEQLDERDLRRRCDLYSVAAAGLRHRSEDRAADQGQSAGQRHSARPSRHELVGQRRQDLLRNRARDHRPRGPVHRVSTTRAKRPSAGRNTRLSTTRRAETADRDYSVHARPDFRLPAVCRHGAGRREDAAVREQRRWPAAGGARHVVPGSFPAHEDQAAVRRLGSGDRRYRKPENVDRRRAWCSIARITRPITNAASGPIRRRCAIRIRRSF